MIGMTIFILSWHDDHHFREDFGGRYRKYKDEQGETKSVPIKVAHDIGIGGALERFKRSKYYAYRV